MKNRLDRVNELIKRELGDLIRREVRTSGKLVTVQQVDIAPNLKNATVWIGVIGTEEERHESMARLHEARAELQHALSRRVILKYTPRLHFQLDEAGERGDRVLQLLSELEPSPESSSPKENQEQ